MSYKVKTTRVFENQFKRLFKKYPSLKVDLLGLIDDLKENPHQGVKILESVYKIRLAIKSKNRGKSGGARVITYVIDENESIILLSLYDKSELESLTENEIKHLLNDYLDELR